MQQNSKLTNERLAQVYQSLKRWADHDDALNSYISGQKIDPIFHDCVVALAELQEYRKAAAESAESAESAGWQAKRPGGNWVSIKNEDIDHYRFNEEVPVREVFTAPPAPISVPAAMEMDDDFDSAFEHGKAVGWNAYRAAMLQGADGNSPVIPDGWVMVPEDPTHEMLEAGDEQFGTYDVYRRMIEAAPKLE